MDFLNKLVIPLSPEHIQLLHYILMLIFFLFVPFISLIFGGTALSIYFRKKGLNKNNNFYLSFAKDVIDTATITKSMGLVLGIITLITAILIYIQLFQQANISTVSYLFGSLLFILTSLILIYTYRYSVTFTNIFDAFKDNPPQDEKVNEDFNKLREGSKLLSFKTGVYGLIFLFVALWLFIAGITLVTYTNLWSDKNVLGLLFSWTVVSRFIVFLSLSVAITGGAILFRFFYWDGGIKNISEEYSSFVRKLAIKLTFTGGLIMPLFLLLDVYNLPDNALSGAVFFYAMLALIFIFLAYQFLYVMITKKTSKYSAPVFFLVLLTIMSVIVKDQLAMDNASQIETSKLSVQFEQTMQKLTGKNKAPKISGKEIYQNICSACHSFDHKVVGPPYVQTVPGYKGNVDELAKFILHPTQKVPGYPPMPNPGLNSAQAHAVAKYIITEVKKYEN